MTTQQIEYDLICKLNQIRAEADLPKDQQTEKDSDKKEAESL